MVDCSLTARAKQKRLLNCRLYTNISEQMLTLVQPFGHVSEARPLGLNREASRREDSLPLCAKSAPLTPLHKQLTTDN